MSKLRNQQSISSMFSLFKCTHTVDIIPHLILLLLSTLIDFSYQLGVSFRLSLSAMDRLTGNTLLGWPTYNTVHLNGASYRQIQFDHPQDQCSFNCYQWQAPSGSAWKSKFTPRAASQADEDERHPYDNYVLLPRTTDDVEGDGGDDGDSSVPVGIHGVKPGCFWEDEDQEMSDQEGAIKFDRSRNCWITAVAFPKALVGLLFGKNQSNLKRLEASTRTQIIVSNLCCKFDRVEYTVYGYSIYV